MAGNEISARIKIDGAKEAISDLKDVGKAAEKIDGETAELKVKADTGTVERDIAGLLAKVDKLGSGQAANLLLTSNASQVMNEIADLSIKLDGLDANDPQVDITVANIGQLQGDLDQISAKAKEINDTPIRLDTSQATTGIDDIGRSADSSKSVLANMIGNSVQDLGALSGVAGSAGVAIGQMGEYIADARASGDSFKQILSGFGAIAAPLAAITVAVSAIGSIFKAAGERAARAKEQVKAFTGALESTEDATGAVEGLVDQLSDFDADARTMWGGFVEGAAAAAAAIPVIGQAIGESGQNISDLIPILNEVGISAEDIGRAAAEGGSEWDRLQVKLWGSQEIGLITADQYAAASQALYGFRDSAEEAGVVSEFLGTSTDEAAKAAEEAAKKIAEMDSAVADAALSLLDAEANSEAFASALDRVNKASELDFAQMAQDTVESFDSVKESLDGIEDKADIDWSNFDITPDEYSELKGMPDSLKAVTDAVSGMRGSIQTELQAAFDSGGLDEYTTKATFFRDEVLGQFPAKFQEMGASEDEAAAKTQELLADLELLPEDIQIVIELTREEEARNALDAFSGVIEQFPDHVQVAINTAIAEGDIGTALALLNNELIQRGYDPIVLEVDAEIQAAKTKADEAQAYADSLVGTEAVDADIAAAQAAADEAKAYADSLTGAIGVDGDNAPAKSETDEAVSYANRQSASIKIDAAKGSGWDNLQRFFGGGTLSIPVSPRPVPRGLAPTPTAAPGVAPLALGPTALTGPTVTPAAVPIGSPAGMAAVQVAAIWEDILHAVNRLGTLTEEGNDTAELAARSFSVVDLENVSAEQANRIAAILEQLNLETVAGNKEAMDALSTELSVAVRELNPAAAATAPAAAVAAEVVKAEAAKAKEDPNTAILEKISNTLLTIASWDKTSSSMLFGEFKYLIQAVQGGSLDPSIVRGAVMAIGAGSA